MGAAPAGDAAEDLTATAPFATPLAMTNPVRGYDWGSRTRLAELQGRPPTGAPEAELWMGAHPSDPSSVMLDGGPVSLADLVERDPAGVLGADCVRRFGERLPFLLKVLAVERALSVQVHPGARRAAHGFAREEAAGPARGGAGRSYVDPHAKPEFLYALTPFEALAGCRPADEAADLLARLDLPVLSPVLAALRGPAARHDGIRPGLEVLVHWPARERPALASAVARRAADLRGHPPHREDDAPPAAGPPDDVLDVVVRLAGEHPGDVLVVAPLLLRLHHLAVGDTLFLPTGVPHAYLGGTAVEIMATSDNVLRAGLTTKPIAADELLAALDPHADVVVGHPWRASGGEQQAWTFPVPEFSLGRTEVTAGAPARLIDPGTPLPHVVLCTRGRVVVHTGGAALELAGGESAFLPGSCGPVWLSGDGEAFRAAPGPA